MEQLIGSQHMTIIRHTLTRGIQAFVQLVKNSGYYLNHRHLWHRVTYCFFAASLTACVTTPPSKAHAQDTTRRDVESYAIASCLVYQKQPYLKDQGDGWASAIVQRAKGDINDLTAVAMAVKTEVAKGNMAVIRNEMGPAPDKLLPVAYCYEILDTPLVHEAVEKAIGNLVPFYKK
jgi:hypothetical protein